MVIWQKIDNEQHLNKLRDCLRKKMKLRINSGAESISLHMFIKSNKIEVSDKMSYAIKFIEEQLIIKEKKENLVFLCPRY